MDKMDAEIDERISEKSDVLNEQNRELMRILGATPARDLAFYSPLEVWVRSFDAVLVDPRRVLILSQQFGIVLEPLEEFLAPSFYRALRAAVWFEANPGSLPQGIPLPSQMINVTYQDFDAFIAKMPGKLPAELAQLGAEGVDLYPNRMGIYLYYVPDRAWGNFTQL